MMDITKLKEYNLGNIMQVLKVVSDGKSVLHHIQQASTVSNATTQVYVDALTLWGLLKRTDIDGGRVKAKYTITKQGTEYLNLFKMISEIDNNGKKKRKSEQKDKKDKKQKKDIKGISDRKSRKQTKGNDSRERKKNPTTTK